MKEPIKPKAPVQPVEPKSHYEVAHQWTTPDGAQINLVDAMKSFPPDIKMEDVYLSSCSSYSDDCYDHTEISYIEHKINPKFEKDKLVFKKKMDKYQEDMLHHKVLMEVYKNEMEGYLVWKQKQEIKELEARLSLLKKK